MVNESSEQDSVWPMPTFYFTLEWGSQSASFQEVSGLETESQPIEYRHGDSKLINPIKMPGIMRTMNVTLKRGILAADSGLFGWFSQIKMNTIERKTVRIKLIDETGEPTMTWELQNAFPTKISSSDLKASGNEVAIETLELAHEGLSISNG